MVVYICAVLGIALIIQEVLHFVERRDLYNRIMSKNYSEYRNDKPLDAQSAHRRTIEKWRKKGDGYE